MCVATNLATRSAVCSRGPSFGTSRDQCASPFPSSRSLAKRQRKAGYSSGLLCDLGSASSHPAFCRVNFFGKIDIFSGRLFDEPKLVIGNRVDLGHNVVFIVNKEIVLEDDINVASGVRFMDTDAHPRDAMARIADLPPEAEEVKPVRIGRYAWIGHNVFVMKGVTIGEGAIIGVNSVVVNDIPPYCVAMGNPARVVVKNTRQTAAAPAPSLQEQRSE